MGPYRSPIGARLDADDLGPDGFADDLLTGSRLHDLASSGGVMAGPRPEDRHAPCTRGARGITAQRGVRATVDVFQGDGTLALAGRVRGSDLAPEAVAR